MASQTYIRPQEADICLECSLYDNEAQIITKTSVDVNAFIYWQRPPAFWDRLSTLQLSHQALEELQRRIRTSSDRQAQSIVDHDSSITRYAMHGGPDMSDLRGCPYPANVSFSALSWATGSQTTGSRLTKTSDPRPTLPKPRMWAAYSRNFEQHLTDHNVAPLYCSEKPRNIDEILAALSSPQPSLSMSDFPDTAFEDFCRNQVLAKDEDDVMANEMATIAGPSIVGSSLGQIQVSARNTVLSNLASLTDGTIAPARPDIYFGALPECLSYTIREEIGRHIVPSTMHDRPVVPDFFVEVQGPDGSAAVATRQARYDGAIGTRAMLSLQNYGVESLLYDGHARSLSVTYHDSLLRIYSHHATATADPDRPIYHMTQLTAHAVTNERAAFVQAASAFRNVSDLAEQYRNELIRAANDRALAKCAGVESVRTSGNREGGMLQSLWLVVTRWPVPDGLPLGYLVK